MSPPSSVRPASGASESARGACTRRAQVSGRRPALLCLAALFALFMGACDDTASVPEPGRATLTLQAPDGRAEGAAVLRISGGGIASPTAVGGQVFTRAGTGGTDLVVVMDTPGTISVTFQVDDLNSLPSAEVRQVSGPSDDLRESLQGYSVKVTR